MVVVGVGGLVRDAGELNVLFILFPFCPSLFFLFFFLFSSSREFSSLKVNRSGLRIDGYLYIAFRLAFQHRYRIETRVVVF